MINLNELNAYRDRSKQVIDHYGWEGDGTCGVFIIPFQGAYLVCVASSENGWDHVSISTGKRTPSWKEMQAMHRRFFKPDEVAMQLHVTPANHVNIHPFCLHLWRPQNQEIPLPPKEFV